MIGFLLDLEVSEIVNYSKSSSLNFYKVDPNQLFFKNYSTNDKKMGIEIINTNKSEIKVHRSVA